jgi:hypothetical protein
MTLYALDPRDSTPVALAAATTSSSSGFGPKAELGAVEPGVYHARATGPAMLCFGGDVDEGGLLVTPDAPVESLIVEDGDKLVAAAMSDACTLTLTRIVEVPAGLIRMGASSSNTPRRTRDLCGL